MVSFGDSIVLTKFGAAFGPSWPHGYHFATHIGAPPISLIPISWLCCSSLRGHDTLLGNSVVQFSILAADLPVLLLNGKYPCSLTRVMEASQAAMETVSSLTPKKV